jgi:hypothetical protein
MPFAIHVETGERFTPVNEDDCNILPGSYTIELPYLELLRLNEEYITKMMKLGEEYRMAHRDCIGIVAQSTTEVQYAEALDALRVKRHELTQQLTSIMVQIQTVNLDIDSLR